jgi:ComF family protein
MGYIYDLFDDFISLLFPRLCNGCGNHLLRGEELVCLDCRLSIPRTGYETVRDNEVEKLMWGRCYLERAAAFSFYTRGSRIRRIIHSLKYKGVKELGPWAGKYYGSTLISSGFMDGIDMIIPVPLHLSKQRKRGFNQSELICSGLSEATGIQLNTTALARVTPSETQTRRSRFERWKNVEGIFRLTDSEQVKGRHILLVDDVITTGSTIEACTNELMKAEGVTVSAVALAVAVR